MALTLVPPVSTPSEETLPLGSITPRLWTRPLRALTPETSYGFRVIWFAAHVLGLPLDPWQQWLAIHLGELLPDGRPRFRRVLVLVARQNGKTHLCVVLTLFWLFCERQRMVFGTSTALEQAAEPWELACEIARTNEALSPLLPNDRSGGIRKTNGQQTLRTVDRCVYKIGAVSPRGGRGKSIDRIVGDELREHRTWDGYNASYNAMNARPAGQAVYITNQGDDGAVVLNSLYGDAVAYLETGEGDERLGLFEWSAAPGSHPMDVAAWAAANPQLGRGRLDYDTLRGPALTVSRPGADQQALAGFLTEALCMRVAQMDPAIDPAAWSAGNVPGQLTEIPGRLAACVDVSPDGQHAALAVAGQLADGRTRVEIVAAWDGPTAYADLRRDLPTWVTRVKPARLGWFPNGPAATLDADMRDRRKDGRRGWPPRGTLVEQLAAEKVPAVVMGFAAYVGAGQLVHSGQALLDAQTLAAEKLHTGDRWMFTRRGPGHVDAIYAAAGAVHIARTMPQQRRSAGARSAPG